MALMDEQEQIRTLTKMFNIPVDELFEYIRNPDARTDILRFLWDTPFTSLSAFRILLQAADDRGYERGIDSGAALQSQFV